MAVAPVFVQDSFRTVGRRSDSAIETKIPWILGISRKKTLELEHLDLAESLNVPTWIEMRQGLRR
jgi:hypothetical protein